MTKGRGVASREAHHNTKQHNTKQHNATQGALQIEHRVLLRADCPPAPTLERGQPSKGRTTMTINKKAGAPSREVRCGRKEPRVKLPAAGTTFATIVTTTALEVTAGTAGLLLAGVNGTAHVAVTLPVATTLTTLAVVLVSATGSQAKKKQQQQQLEIRTHKLTKSTNH